MLRGAGIPGSDGRRSGRGGEGANAAIGCGDFRIAVFVLGRMKVIEVKYQPRLGFPVHNPRFQPGGQGCPKTSDMLFEMLQLRKIK